MAAFYHLCFIVKDLDAAIEQMTRTLGVTWRPIQENRLGEWTTHMVFSEGDVPLLELIESRTGSPWDAGDGSCFDHLGFWSRDIGEDKVHLVARGAPMDYDADAAHDRAFTYHRLDSIGARVELVDVRRQPRFIANWAPQLAPMAPPSLSNPPDQQGAESDGEICHRLLVDLFACVDRGRATDALVYFTQDAIFAVDGRQLLGREQIAEFFAERQQRIDRHTVHIVANFVVRGRSAAELRATALLLVHVRATDATMALEQVLATTMLFVRTPNGWLLQHRDVESHSA